MLGNQPSEQSRIRKGGLFVNALTLEARHISRLTFTSLFLIAGVLQNTSEWVYRRLEPRGVRRAIQVNMPTPTFARGRTDDINWFRIRWLKIEMHVLSLFWLSIWFCLSVPVWSLEMSEEAHSDVQKQHSPSSSSLALHRRGTMWPRSLTKLAPPPALAGSSRGWLS